MQELDQPHMDGLDGFPFHYHTDINGLPLIDESQLSQTYQPAFDPPAAGHSGLLFGPRIIPLTH